MNKRRSDCPLSCGLEVFGDKWTLLIVRDMFMFGKKNFKEFIISDEKIATNILTNRLQKMLQNGLILKEIDKRNKLIINYSLTEKGFDLAPVAAAVLNWGKIYISDTKDVVMPKMS